MQPSSGWSRGKRSSRLCSPFSDVGQKLDRGAVERFVAIQKSLGLSNVVGIGCGYIEKIAASIKVGILRMENGRFQRTLVPNPQNSPKPFDPLFLDRFNVLQSKKRRLAHG